MGVKTIIIHVGAQGHMPPHFLPANKRQNNVVFQLMITVRYTYIITLLYMNQNNNIP